MVDTSLNKETLDAFNRVADGLATLIEELRSGPTRDEMKLIEKRRARGFFLTSAGILVATTLSVVIVVLAFQVRAAQRSGHSSQGILIECNTPSTSSIKHECYDQKIARQSSNNAALIAKFQQLLQQEEVRILLKVQPTHAAK